MSAEKPPTPPTAANGGTPAGSATKACPNPCSTPQKSGKGGNTTVQVDNTQKKVFIQSKLAYSGPDATAAYAADSKAKIESVWSGKTMVNGEPYDVVTNVDTVVGETRHDDARLRSHHRRQHLRTQQPDVVRRGSRSPNV